jgi:lipopolysaccharide/colanic/teichoic acid biosynthesis glycosyltransferase
MLKRCFDAVVSAAALVVLSPVLLAIAIRIKLSSPGPVFYRGVRVGRLGRTFRILKFRTMVVDAERIGGSATADDDPRITPVGTFLRKRKLDELPQLWNVLLGDMSLVGPRPEVPQYVALYNDAQKAILNVRPGITDWASLWDCDEGALLAGSPDPEKAYLEQILPEKLRLQLEYVRRCSFRTDLSILAKTLLLVLRRKNQHRLLSERAPWAVEHRDSK